MQQERWVLLDTDVWSILFARSRRSSDPREQAWRSVLAGRGIVIATQTRAEVLTGLATRDVGTPRRQTILAQLDAASTVPVTEDVIVAYADLTAACRRHGHPLHAKHHTGDRWVAASAIAAGVPLLAGDGIYQGAPGVEVLADSVPGHAD